jgi:hypothetical protein
MSELLGTDKKVYLGYGVYGKYDGFQIILTTETYINISNKIFFGFDGWVILKKFINKHHKRENEALGQMLELTMKKYEWKPAEVGLCGHWEMPILDDNGVLHVEGSTDEEWFRGHIQLSKPFYVSNYPSLYISHNFTDLEECQKHLEGYYRTVMLRELLNFDAKGETD